jgi:proline iminopeptidase
MTPASRRIAIRGASLACTVLGEAYTHPVILLHGGRGIGNHAKDLQAYGALADRYRVIGFDMRGHGQSSLTGPLTFSQLVEDLEEVRQTLGGGRPMTLIGGSFGGMIALSYAVRYPHGLTHLVLRGTAPSWHHEVEAKQAFEARLHRAPMATREMLDKLLSDQVTDDAELRLICFALSPMYEDRLDMNVALESARRIDVHAATHNALFAVKDYDVREQLASIRTPTLVVCGDQDWICPPGQSRWIAQAIPGARLLMVPGCGHYVHIEANTQVLTEIRQLLGEGRPLGPAPTLPPASSR